MLDGPDCKKTLKPGLYCSRVEGHDGPCSVHYDEIEKMAEAERDIYEDFFSPEEPSRGMKIAKAVGIGLSHLLIFGAGMATWEVIKRL